MTQLQVSSGRRRASGERVRWFSRFAIVGVLATLGVLTPVVASAHAGFVSSSPEPGATLGSAPGQVTLTFSEPLNMKLSRATVAMPDGRSVEGRATRGDRIVVDLTTNQTGVYEVSWTTVSLVDGHTLTGSFRFGVGVSPGPGAAGGTADEPTGVDLLIAVGRLVEDLSLLLLVGSLLLWRLANRAPSIVGVRTPIPASAVAALAGGVVVVAGEALNATGSTSVSATLGYLTTGVPGWSRLARVLLEAAGVAVASRRPQRAAPLAAAALIALAAAGHAAAVQPRAWGIAVEAVHLLSAGLWAGGVMALALQQFPGGWRSSTATSLLDRFTPVALAAFGVTAATGLIRGFQEVGGWSAIFGSAYGLVLVAKVIFVLAMVELSVLAWRRIAFFPKAETVAAVLAIAAAALLSAFPLPPGRQAEASEERQTTEIAPVPAGAGLTLGSHAGPVLVGLTVNPARPGRNDLTFFVLGLNGPEATAALRVRATVDGAPVPLSQCADNCRKGEADLTGGEVVTVEVGPGDRTAIFRLPAVPAPAGDARLRRTIHAMEGVSSYRLDEVLTSGLGTTVHTTYAFAAPNSFASELREPGGTFRTIWIGGTRYTREDDQRWEIDRGVDAPPVPTYIWDSFEPYRDVRIVGHETLAGIRTIEIAFAGGRPDLPVWFRLWVDGHGLVHRAEMRAPGHFMDHRYFDYDAPISIEPPEGVA
jgi:copper transport protein